MTDAVENERRRQHLGKVGTSPRRIFTGATGERGCGSKADQKVCLKGGEILFLLEASQSEISVFV